MTDKAKDVVENGAAEATGMVLDKLDQYMSSAQEVISQYGGDAVDLGLNVLRIEAASNVLTAFLWLVIIGIAVYKGHKFLVEEVDVVRGSGKKLRYTAWIDESDGFAILPIGIFYIGGIALLVFNMSDVIDMWSWVGVFWPEAYAVHKFLL